MMVPQKVDQAFLRVEDAFYTLVYKTLGESGVDRLEEWLDRQYYASAGKKSWRFWFEITGQGRAARSWQRQTNSMRKVP